MRDRSLNGRKQECSKCGKIKEESRSRYAYCKSCHAEFMRKTRPIHSMLEPEAKKKANARSYANVYYRRGLLLRQPCLNCGDLNSQKHHEDYDKPLDVTWLCRRCHLAEHEKTKNKSISNL